MFITNFTRVVHIAVCLKKKKGVDPKLIKMQQ